MKLEAEVVWRGGGSLTESLERDYAAMRGDGWELIYEPPSPITTPWGEYSHLAHPDPNVCVRSKSAVVRRIRQRAETVGRDWQGDYVGAIAYGSHGGRR